MIYAYEIDTQKRNEFIDITSDVNKAVLESKIKEGIVVVYVPHTTAAVTINENGDPDVVSDIILHLSKIVPNGSHFKHSEGNSDAHIKSSMMGCSKTIIIKDGKLLLGTWQSIYFCEFDGPREIRKFYVKII
ncbi:MAG: secondary thiamine-phosphate synthase enzyme YjbQ [Candidatus Woesearchaeota archaeon]|jgi:secondary thiamine-phosphate synthase enzyme